MKETLFSIMGITSLVVMLFGAFLVIVGILYAIENLWSKHSTLAKNVKDYLLQKDDFRLYQHDISEWDRIRNRHHMECQACQYRQEHLKREAENATEPAEDKP